MAIDNDIYEIQKAITLFDEILGLENQAKNKAIEARTTLMAVAGDIEPPLLREAITSAIRAQDLFEKIESECVIGKESAQAYMHLLGN